MKRASKLKFAAMGSLLCASVAASQNHKVLAQENTASAQPAKPTVASEEILINTAALTAPLIAQQLLSGEFTVEEAYEQKLLTIGDAWYLLSEHIDDWGGLNGQRDEKVRRDLVAFLVKYSKTIAGVLKPQDASKPSSLSTTRLAKLPLKLRLWLADYFQSIGDQRTVPFAESVLSTLKAQQVKLNPEDVRSVILHEALVFQALERIGWYYGGKGEFVKAAQTWERVEQVVSSPSSAMKWMIPDAQWWAAQSYWQAGDKAKAQKYYAQVPSHGDNFFSGLAQEDQAFFAYHGGDISQARVHAQKAVAHFEAAGDPDRVKGYKTQVERLLGHLEVWSKQPVQVLPEAVVVGTHDAINNNVVTKKIVVRMQKTVPFSVRCANPDVKIEILPVDLEKTKNAFRYYDQQEVLIRVPQKLLFHDSETYIVVECGAWKTQFSLQIKARPFIELYPQSNLFWGFVKAGEKQSKTLKLRAEKPFVVKSSNSDSFLSVQVESRQPATEHSVIVGLKADARGKIYEGHLQLQIDLPEQEVIRVPYYAYVE